MGSADIKKLVRGGEEVTVEDSEKETLKTEKKMKTTEDDYKVEIVWSNVMKFVVLHAMALAGLLLQPQVSLPTHLFVLVCYFMGAMGITAGAHRLWAHRSYKATLPLRLFLAYCNTTAAQNSIYVWCRDHRAHHKFSETDGDPHNCKRGFFFSHIGWLMCRKHPSVISQGSKIDLSDLTSDPVIMFQHRHYILLSLISALVVPTVVPYLFWNESLHIAYLAAVLRYVISLHATWLVNSAAHMWGDRPYDARIAPAENMLVSLLAAGEGFHNYHHVFPWDYGVSEWRYALNGTTVFIDVCCWAGLAYDRRSASAEAVRSRSARTGQGKMKKNNNDDEEELEDPKEY